MGAASACAGMTVGGLTHHLLSQVKRLARFLAQPPTTDDPIRCSTTTREPSG